MANYNIGLMKKTLYLCLLLFSFSYPLNLSGQNNAVHCIGNGEMLMYGSKVDILQLFGPPYSSPSIFSMKLEPGFSVQSYREKGTAIWHHSIFKQGEPVAEIIDFMASDIPCFIRKIKASSSFSFQLEWLKNGKMLNNLVLYEKEKSTSSAYLFKTPSGTYFYNNYPTPNETCHQFVTMGNCSFHTDKLQIERGESYFLVIGEPSYPDCITATNNVLSQSTEDLLAQTKVYWSDFSSRRKNFDEALPASLPQREKLLQTIDDVAILIKCQQNNEGAVMAGYNYHLGYVRDQYGVSRGLLKLGYTDEAQKILDFYFSVWQKYGRIHNAQGAGNHAFHIHENDDVEITGYLIIQAFDYLKATNNHTFVRKIFPMLNWAWNVQTKQLIKGMLSFNGDETFIAGGILPRTAIYDGSAEATLLFINGGEQLLSWAKKQKLWNNNEISRATETLNQTKEIYAANFINGDKLQTNNPDRMIGQTYPAFRHGVCERIGQIEGCEIFGWTQRTNTNRYLCANCYTKSTLPEAVPEIFFLPSVTLMPDYIHDTFLNETLKTKFVNELANYYSETGRFPSWQQNSGDYKILGYDYGIFLYALTNKKNPIRYKIYEDMMNALDETGAWVEYYMDGKPNGTFCRPWESAINLEAALWFAETEKK